MPDTPLSIIIPAYNEVNAVKEEVERIQQICANNQLNAEIIIVDDGSTDGTAEVVTQLSGVILKKHSVNLGYGAALKTGIKASSHDIICITDADGTYPNDQIPHLFNQFIDDDLDMLVGARTGSNVNIPLVRKPAKWVLNQFANYLTGVKIPDLNSGLRVMRKSVVQRFLGILPNGFSFTTTITLAMLTNSYRVQYEKIDYHARTGKSKIRPIHDTLNFVQLIVRTTMYFQPLKVFLPMGFFFFILSGGLFVYRICVQKSFAVTIVILFVTGIQIVALGMIADMINKRMN